MMCCYVLKLFFFVVVWVVLVVVIVLLVGVLVGCKKVLLVSVDVVVQLVLLVLLEDVQIMGNFDFVMGLVIIGLIQLEKCVDLCVEVQVVVLQVFKENGECVKKGDLLVCLDDMVICDSLVFVDELVCVSSQSFDQVEWQFQWMKML